MKNTTDESGTTKSRLTQDTELLLLPDGRVLAHALTPEADALLRALFVVLSSKDTNPQESNNTCPTVSSP